MPTTLPLFPLKVVIFPEGLLPLKIFEARYLDMVRDCLRNQSDFGVVTTDTSSHKDQGSERLPFSLYGTSMSILEADVPQPGLMTLRCQGKRGFYVRTARQQGNGLWIGEVDELPAASSKPIPDDLLNTSLYLQRLIDSLSEQGVADNELPALKPFKLNDCEWVANRWCEMLDIPLSQKLKLMEVKEPLERLTMISDILRLYLQN